MRLLRTGILAAIGVALAGCESRPIDTFYAHERPAETATVRNGFDVYCMQINAYFPNTGETPEFDIVPPGQDRRRIYTVGAGPTTLVTQFIYKSSFGHGVSDPKTVTFTALPGHRYTLVSKAGLNALRIGTSVVKNADWDVQVVDRDSDQVAGETHERDAAPTTAPAK